ncbi:hypothetical protein [Lysobacter gummosus]|uniref:hypothetical protein n=1 Tax=Lysobacter gummosus TaxID=262324 RepID=UPI00363A3BA3
MHLLLRTTKNHELKRQQATVPGFRCPRHPGTRDRGSRSLPALGLARDRPSGRPVRSRFCGL